MVVQSLCEGRLDHELLVTFLILTVKPVFKCLVGTVLEKVNLEIFYLF